MYKISHSPNNTCGILPGIRVHAYLTEESGRPALPALFCLLLLLLSVMSLAQSGFHPFIYFQF